MMTKSILLTSLLFVGSGCVSTSATNKTDSGKPDTPVAPKQCLASQPKSVSMWVNLMPGPGASGRAPLHASFTVTTPTPGYQFALKLNRVMESFPEQVVLDLIVTRPTGMVAQVITESEVSLKLANFPGSEGSSVQVNCEGVPFFKVDKLMAVH